MKHERVIGEAGKDSIVLRWYDDDPCSWMVRRMRKGFFGRRCAHSAWFSTEAQAEAHAKRLTEAARG